MKGDDVFGYAVVGFILFLLFSNLKKMARLEDEERNRNKLMAALHEANNKNVKLNQIISIKAKELEAQSIKNNKLTSELQEINNENAELQKKINTLIQDKNSLALSYDEAQKRNEALENETAKLKKEHTKNNEKIFELNQLISNLSEQNTDLTSRVSFLESLYEKLNSSVVKGRQWLLDLLIEAITAKDNATVEVLKTKRNPAIKAAEKLTEAQAEKRALLKRAKQLEYQLKTYEEYFPFLVDYQIEILNDEIKPANDMDLVKDAKGEAPDIVRKYISADEYKSLSSAQRNQLALDRYLSGDLSNVELGRLYERYIGYIYEQQGYSVEYTGIEKGLEDLGQDLICTKGMSTIVIQAKCWSQTKLIREKHILQLFATTLLRKIGSNPEREYTSILITSTKLSDVAKTVAQALGVQYKEEVPLDKGYPLIKCNINQTTKEKIYHLPFDQMYDKVKIEPQLGEHYVATTKEAEAKGFRRAFKYRGV